jgi:hypothetical protein
MLGLYQGWGFRSSPFEPRPLPPTAEGKKLLVGRDAELSKIIQRLLTAGKLVAIEGPNGIGKTSVNNIAAYEAFSAFLNGESDQLIIPCESVRDEEDNRRKNILITSNGWMVEYAHRVGAGSLFSLAELDDQGLFGGEPQPKTEEPIPPGGETKT